MRATVQAFCYIRETAALAGNGWQGRPQPVPESSPPDRESIADLIEEALEETPGRPADKGERAAAVREDAPSFDPSQALDFGKASSRRPSVAVGLGGRALRALVAPVASPRRALLLLVLLSTIAFVAYRMQSDNPRAFDDIMQPMLDAVRGYF